MGLTGVEEAVSRHCTRARIHKHAHTRKHTHRSSKLGKGGWLREELNSFTSNLVYAWWWAGVLAFYRI